MEFAEMVKRVSAAVEEFLSADEALLLNDAHERSITHRLAVHLSTVFDGWDVDCEYNRNRDDTKQLRLCREANRRHCINLELGEAADIPLEYLDKSKVYPDIIVHHRNSADNLLVVEVKKSTNTSSREFDLHKLRAYMCQLEYRYGLFIEFCAKDDYRPAVFQDEEPFTWCWMVGDADGSLECHRAEIPA